VPALHVMALWLHGGQGDAAGDLLVPLDPSPVQTPAGRPAPAAVLLRELAARSSLVPPGPGDMSGS
jgi:hypothetical protein